ncbi:MAG: DUF1134 domain-containing protein [Desulforhopalus sp.]|nr:DUF1134 domain-containing protein [Desulforhopalus sp.]
MKKLLNLATLLVVITFLLFGLSGCFSSSDSKNSAASHDANASGTLTIDETQMMLIVGGTFGGGYLDFQGESYKFKIKGLKLGGIGLHKISLTGDVYKLSDIKDFAGIYFAAEAGITVGKGVGGFWLKNSKGVTLHLKASTEGIALAIGVEGLRISM